ncbi:hypothetical protein Tcan_16591 [Toxocara canis]|uniref:Uncharacterized protein n=1 Tax=Toxocara canis TaxID=6265 RepID=A0A0B2V3R2_TOXCA|nr:hypothetical protein Tcan_16591 [Toxocara canis]
MRSAQVFIGLCILAQLGHDAMYFAFANVSIRVDAAGVTNTNGSCEDDMTLSSFRLAPEGTILMEMQCADMSKAAFISELSGIAAKRQGRCIEVPTAVCIIVAISAVLIITSLISGFLLARLFYRTDRSRRSKRLSLADVDPQAQSKTPSKSVSATQEDDDAQLKSTEIRQTTEEPKTVTNSVQPKEGNTVAAIAAAFLRGQTVQEDTDLYSESTRRGRKAAESSKKARTGTMGASPKPNGPQNLTKNV